jgi:catechol 2,3-dioxygenase-like lactoylglutathione lyase family enzyme
MNLNHVNLTVTNVPAAAEFLQTYFGLKHAGGNAGMAFLIDEQGMVLSLMKAGRAISVDYPETFHIGFFVESETLVDEVNQRLRADGYDVGLPERHHAYGFYVKAPGGFTVELGA